MCVGSTGDDMFNPLFPGTGKGSSVDNGGGTVGMNMGVPQVFPITPGVPAGNGGEAVPFDKNARLILRLILIMWTASAPVEALVHGPHLARGAVWLWLVGTLKTRLILRLIQIMWTASAPVGALEHGPHLARRAMWL